MTKDDFIGVWKLLEYGEGKIITSKTHLVVQEDILWEVHPDTVYYENEQGPEVGYQFEEGQMGKPARLSQADGFKYLVKLEGDILFIKLGSSFGKFPEDFNDRGNLGKYTREDPELAKTIGILPTKVPLETLKIRGFGTLQYDANAEWWTCQTKFQGKKIQLQISAHPEDKFGPLEGLKKQLAPLSVFDYPDIATNHLLSLFNESWNDSNTALHHENFKAKVRVRTITLELNGKAAVWLKDGGLFQGHSIVIDLDATQQITDVGIVG